VSPAARASRLAAEHTISIGTLAAVVVVLTSWYGALPAWYELLVYSLAACALGTRTIRLSRTLGTVSVSFVFVFAALVELGPLAGVIAALASALGATLICPLVCGPKKPISILVIGAAIGNVVLSAAAAGWAHTWIDRICVDAGIPLGVLPAFVVIGVYYMVNSMGVAVMASTTRDRTALQIWSDNLSWTVLPFYVGGAVVMAIHLVALAVGPIVWLALIPPVIVIHTAMALRAKAAAAALAERRAAATH
jgi:hypothetical protein